MHRARFLLSPNLLLTLILSTILTSLAVTADARRDPERPSMFGNDHNHGPDRAAGQTDKFVCGTYKGNEIQTRMNYARHKKIMKDVAAGRVSVNATPLDYVNDDVWIIEDDGTLLFSGLNTFDTDNRTFRFTPNGTAFDLTEITFDYDANFGGGLATGDDGSVLSAIGFTFPFAGSNWTQMYVGGNGLVTFGAAPNPSGFYDPGDFFSATPQIDPYYMDLDPSGGGSVQRTFYSDRIVITWVAVPEWGTSVFQTVQLKLWDDGKFDITFNGIGALTQGNGSPIFSGFDPGGGAALDIISYSDDPPYSGSPGNGFYEEYLNITNPIVNENALLSRFITAFGDIFFQITFFTNFVQTMGGFANELNISNDVTGIGLGIFDGSSSYGSASVLESRCNMNRLAVWPADPNTRFFVDGNNFLTIMGQESGHRWGAFLNFRDTTGTVSNLILGRSNAHWSYFVDNDHSSLEGGNWQLVSGNNYTCPTQIDLFPGIDEYCFGLRLPEEVKDIYFLSSPINNLLANRSAGTPVQGAAATGTPVQVTVGDIISAEGARTPTEPNEEHDLRHGFILLVQQGNVPTVGELNKVGLFRSSWEDYFELSCDGRLTCNTSLTSEFDVARVKGNVINKLTDEIVDEFTSTSVERGFVQHVPGGGRYTFRYQADGGSGSSEAMTIITTAAGYYPDTCVTSVDYGDSLCKDIELIPVPTGVPPGTPLPNALYQNYPNPFNPVTTIRYDTRVGGNVRLTIVNVAGQEIATLISEHQSAGDHYATWEGRDKAGREVASGIYFYRLQIGDFVKTRKMVLLK